MTSKLVSESKRQNLADTLHFKEGYFHYKGLPTTPGDVLTIADTFGQITLAPGGGGAVGEGIREWSHYLVCLPTDLPFAEYPAGNPAPNPPVFSGPNSINDAIVAANAAYVLTNLPQVVLIRPGTYVQNVTWLEGVLIKGAVADTAVYSGTNASPCLIQGVVTMGVPNSVGMNMQGITVEAPIGQPALNILPANRAILGCKDCTFYKTDNQTLHLIDIGGQINTSATFDHCIFQSVDGNVVHTYGGNPLTIRSVRFNDCLLSGGFLLAPAANMSEDFKFFRCILTPSSPVTFTITQTNDNFGQCSIDFWNTYVTETRFISNANGANPGTSAIQKSYYNCIFENCLWDEATSNTGNNTVENTFYNSTLTDVDKFGTLGNCTTKLYNSTLTTTDQVNWTTVGGILYYENCSITTRTGANAQKIIDCQDTEITLLNCNVKGSLVENSVFLEIQSNTNTPNFCSVLNNTIAFSGVVGVAVAYVIRINDAAFNPNFSYSVQVCNNSISRYGSVIIFCPTGDLKFNNNSIEGSGTGTPGADLVRLASTAMSSVCSNEFQGIDVRLDGVQIPGLNTKFSHNQVRGFFEILGRVDNAVVTENFFDHQDSNGDSVHLGVPGSDGNFFCTFTNNTTSDHVFVYINAVPFQTFVNMQNNSLSTNFNNGGAPVVRIGNMLNILGVGSDLRFFNNVYTIGNGPSVDTTSGVMIQNVQSQHNISFPSNTGINLVNIPNVVFTGLVQ